MSGKCSLSFQSSNMSLESWHQNGTGTDEADQIYEKLESQNIKKSASE